MSSGDAGVLRLEDAYEATKDILKAIGEDPTRNGLIDTPKRVTKAWKEMGRTVDAIESAVGDAIFDLEAFQGDPGWVTVKHIPFSSISSETLLPYHGVCHVAYKIGKNKILGLSKAARLIQVASMGIKSQQALMETVRKTIEKVTGSAEVAVVSTVTHMYYDRPLTVVTASSLATEIKNNEDEVRELMMLLGMDEIDASFQKFGHPSNVAIDRVVLSRMRSAAARLFQSLRIDIDQGAIDRYCHQLYCATIGRREMTVYPTDITIEDRNDPRGEEGTISCTVDFRSLCEHHLLPFYGKVSVACRHRSSDDVALTEKLKSLMTEAALKEGHQPQVQERLTNSMADVVMQLESVEAAVVVCEAVHMCMIARGARTHSSLTRTATTRGDITQSLIRVCNESLLRCQSANDTALLNEDKEHNF